MLCTKTAATTLCRTALSCYATLKCGHRPLSGPEDMAGKRSGPNAGMALTAVTHLQVLSHTLATRHIAQSGITALLDAVACDDGKLRAFFGAGTATTPGATGPAPPEQGRWTDPTRPVSLKTGRESQWNRKPA